MKITKKTLCAMRAVMYIATEIKKDSTRLIAIREIARCQKISVSYLEQVLNKLKQAKIIIAKRGPNGGYKLFKPAEQITLFEIVDLFEQSYRIIDCAKPGELCTGLCSLAKPVWDDFNSMAEEYMRKVSIADYV